MSLRFFNAGWSEAVQQDTPPALGALPTLKWMRGLIIDCGCFGGAQANPIGLAILGALGPVGDFLSKEKADLVTIVRDIILFGMAVHLFFVRSIFSLDNLRQRANRDQGSGIRDRNRY